jgi:hypothetical protein
MTDLTESHIPHGAEGLSKKLPTPLFHPPTAETVREVRGTNVAASVL